MVLLPPMSTSAQGPVPSMLWCAEALKAGRAGSIFAPEVELQDFLLNHGGCDSFSYAPALRGLFRLHFNLAVGGHAGDAFAIATNLTRGLYKLASRLDYVNLLEEHLLEGRVCPTDSEFDEAGSQLEVRHLSGLFIFTFATLAASVVGAIAERSLRARCAGGKGRRCFSGPAAEKSAAERSRPAERGTQEIEAKAVSVTLQEASSMSPLPPADLRGAREQCLQLLSLLSSMEASGASTER